VDFTRCSGAALGAQDGQIGNGSASLEVNRLGSLCEKRNLDLPSFAKAEVGREEQLWPELYQF